MPKVFRTWWLWWLAAVAVCAATAAWLFWIKKTSGIDRVPASALTLAFAALAMIPLIRLFRSEERRDLLQKCLLASLLVHVVLVMGFSAVRISRAIVQYVREQTRMEIPINLEAGQVAEVQLAVRGQMSEMAAPIPAPAIQIAAVPKIEVPLELNPPRMLESFTPAVRPSAMAIHVPTPRGMSPEQLQRIAVATPRVSAIMPELRLPDVAPLVQKETRITTEAPRPAVAPVRPIVAIDGPQIGTSNAAVRPDTAVRPTLDPVAVKQLPPSLVAEPRATVRVSIPSVDVPIAPQPKLAEASPRADIEPPRPTDPARSNPREGLSPPIDRPDVELPVDRVANRSTSTVGAHMTSRRPEDVELGPALVQTGVDSTAGAIGPTDLPTLETYAQREAKNRAALVEAYGGSKETEAAVALALKYLAANQQADGRWMHYDAEISPKRNRDEPHDMALTALATLCFLAADQTPAHGEHHDTVAKAIRFLLSHEGRDGDFRGDGSMYDQAMVTVALAEAGIMAREPAYRAAAARGAKFIIDVQNDRTGGWRYTPYDAGDVSVTGWQLLALSSARKAGAKLPDEPIARAMQYLDRLCVGDDRVLARYQLDQPPTPSMTAHATFSRMIFGRPLTSNQLAIASEFVIRQLPGQGEKDFYRWYCTSLMLMQIQNDAWRKWNAAASTHLVELQRKAGPAGGSWDGDDHWGKWGGRIYSTSMACLTLEVYYRYLPMYAKR